MREFTNMEKARRRNRRFTLGPSRKRARQELLLRDKTLKKGSKSPLHGRKILPCIRETPRGGGGIGSSPDEHRGNTRQDVTQAKEGHERPGNLKEKLEKLFRKKRKGFIS